MAKAKFVACQIIRNRNQNYHFYFHSLIILLLINCLLENNMRLLTGTSEIRLVVLGTGEQTLINFNNDYIPTQILVNGASCDRVCNLIETTNNVIIKFNPGITNCAGMFQGLNKIKEIDLSNFDFSAVFNMVNMFNGCSGLDKIIFGNIQTTSLLQMTTAFQGCSSLISIDLSNFDFSKVHDMYGVFMFCSSLEEIKFGDINTESLVNAGVLFQGCTSLKSIDLSHFDFSKVNTFYGMFLDCTNLVNVTFGNLNTLSLENMGVVFQNCQKLEYVDLSGINFSKVTNMANMFYNCVELKSVNFGDIVTSSLVKMNGMFQQCSKLTEVDLSKFDTSKVDDMSNMFNLCTNLQNVNFGNIITSSLTNMRELFRQCYNLKSVDLSKFDLSNVVDMDLMFFQCSNLENVNFGNSPTSSLKQMFQLFQECYKLESIDLSNFDTSQVTTMQLMFNSCTNLKYLNLSNFKTSQITTVNNMFSGSHSLVYLDLYSFELDSNVNIDNIFGGLSPNVIICIHDTNTKSYLSGTNKIFFCSDECATINNFKIDINEGKCVESCLDTSNDKYEYNNKCYNKCPTGTLVLGNQCINKDCNVYPENPIECEGDEPLGFYLDPNDGIYLKCYETCKFCHGEGDATDHNCRQCKSGYRNLNDFDNDKNCYVNCPHYYYFYETNTYQCTTDATCPVPYNILITEKGKCIDQCSNDNIYKYEYHGECYNYLINETTYINNNIVVESTDKENDLVETSYKQDNMIPSNKEEDYISQTTYNGNIIQETIYKVGEYKPTSINIDERLYHCSNDNPLMNKCSMVDISDNDEIYSLLKSDILSRYSHNNGKSIVIEGEDDIIFQITNAKNELELLKSNNISDEYNLSIIDLAECEALLKEEYHINPNDSLIFLKKEKVTSKASEKDIQYECFEPYNKTKLNMSICSSIDINIYVKLELSEEAKAVSEHIKSLGYNMFDINDRFYTDLCTPYKTLVNSDILLSDRVDYIYNNEDAQCQGNCEFSNYYLGSKYINCRCSVNNEDIIDTEKIDKFETKSLYQMFYLVLKYSNYEVLKCYKLVFVKTVLSKNWGSIIIFILFILYLICLIFYIVKGIAHLKNCTENILGENGKINGNKINLFFPPFKKKKSSLKDKGKQNKNEMKKPNIVMTEKEPEKKNIKSKKTKNDSTKSLTIFEQGKNKKKSKFRNKDSTKTAIQFEKEASRKSSFAPFFNKENEKMKSSSKAFISNTEIINPKKSKKDRKSKSKYKGSQSEVQLDEKNIENQPNQLDDFELNDLSYPEAIIMDQRNFFQIYLSLLKREHRIIFTFFICRDYNLKPVKMSRFIFLLATDIAMNVFFFSDASMHKIFLNYGKYNFVQQIPQIIYSTIVSQIIEVFLCFLSLTDKHIYQIKSLEININNSKVIKEVLKCIKIKLVIYFVITFIFFCFYW